MRIKIRNDLFDISDRIKRIDPNYEIYFDTQRQKYVIMAFGVLQVVVPYDELDVRTLDLVWKTRKENVEKILKEVDDYNALKQKEEVKRVQDEIENEYSRRLRIAGI